MLAFISLIFFASTALAAIISSPRLSLGEGVVDNIMHRDAFVLTLEALDRDPFWLWTLGMSC
jgi:hypothetical protein